MLLRHARATRRKLYAAAFAVCAGAAAAAAAAITPGQVAPDFTLRAVNGPNLRLHELRGRVVLVNFWATWREPSGRELPQLNRLHDKYRDAGLSILGVSVDEEPRLAAEMAAELGLRFVVLLDTEKTVVRRYDPATVPATLLIDRDGRVRHVFGTWRGGLEQEYEKKIRELLAL